MPLQMNLEGSCEVTGFVPQHARACENVAERMNCIILFREPGKASQGLIADNYSMKGFRIDTKSCNWGPMRGFVCADPRLSKHQDEKTKTSFATENKKWTQEALDGHINTKYFELPDADEQAAWKAGLMPIVISKARIDELVATKKITIAGGDRNRGFHGVSSADFSGDATGNVVFPWKLMPTTGAAKSWLKDEQGKTYPGEYFALCVDPRKGFQQQYPSGVKPISFHGYETVLGMINPGTANRGFKACITADYDLFAIWPAGKADAMAGMHNVVGHLDALRRAGGGNGNLKPSQMAAHSTHYAPSMFAAPMAQGVKRLPHVDDRLRAQGQMEHYRYGDVSARVLTIKTMLNTAIKTEGGYKGGNTIHHNDESGNMVLAKPNLEKCLPLIGFFPNQGTFCIQTMQDFKLLVLEARRQNYKVIAKDTWLKAVGLE